MIGAAIAAVAKAFAPEVPAGYVERAAWLAESRSRLESTLAEERLRLEQARTEVEGKAERGLAAIEAEAEARHAELSSQIASELNTQLDAALIGWRGDPTRQRVGQVIRVLQAAEARARTELGRELNVRSLMASMAIALVGSKSDEDGGSLHLERSLFDIAMNANPASSTALVTAASAMKAALTGHVPVVSQLLLRLESEMLEGSRPAGAASAETRQRFNLIRSHACPTLRTHALQAFDAKCGEAAAARSGAEYEVLRGRMPPPRPVVDDEDDEENDEDADPNFAA